MLNRLGEVFASFHNHQVKYLVIGGIAAVLHGVPRATFDLDILIEATEDNAERLLEAMIEARLGTATLIDSQELLAQEITIFQDRVFEGKTTRYQMGISRRRGQERVSLSRLVSLTKGLVY